MGLDLENQNNAFRMDLHSSWVAGVCHKRPLLLLGLRRINLWFYVNSPHFISQQI